MPTRGSGTSSFIVYPGGGGKPKSFGYLKSARVFAKQTANASGVSSIIYGSGGRSKTHHVKPDRRGNPISIPGGRWFKAEVRKIGRKLHLHILTPARRKRRNPRKGTRRRRR